MILALLLGCLLISEDEKEGMMDPDGDGALWPEDCDDDDASVHPGATETCDGVDQDCDGETDEDPADAGTLYADADGDGFGDAASPRDTCAGPSAGWVEDATDCDDADAATYPGAPAACRDLRVNDCDGDPGEEARVCQLAGELDMNAIDDREGFTSLLDPVASGMRGFGAVLLGSGTNLEGELAPLEPDGLLIGAPSDEGLVSAAWWSDSPWPDSEDYAADVELAQTSWQGPGEARLGAALASVGTVCGEDSTTLVVGAPGVDTLYLLTLPAAAEEPGEIAALTGSASLTGWASLGAALGAEGLQGSAAVAVGAPDANAAGFLDLKTSADCADLEGALVQLDTPDGAAGFGQSVAAGDITGDEIVDYFVSGDEDGASALWFFDGSCAAMAGCGERMDLGELRGPVSAMQIIDYAGSSSDPCSPDGILDLLVGAPESGEDQQGQVMLLEGDSEGAPRYNAAGFGVRAGVEDGDHFGTSLVVDNLALEENSGATTPLVLVGAPGVEVINRNNAPDEGAVYGWIGIESWCGAKDALDPTFVLYGTEGEQLGSALGRLHDMDRDPARLPELAVGAPGFSDGAGRVLLVPIFPY